MADIFYYDSTSACESKEYLSRPGGDYRDRSVRYYGCELRYYSRSEFTKRFAKPTPNASQQPSPQNRTASPPPSQPKPTAIKGGNRNKCIKHSKAKEQYGYNFTNNCNETVYVEIVRETDGGLYHFTLKPGETTRHFWGEGKSKFRACKGGDSTALDACGG